jgi:tetratricopeptide (TPR) repeat protein
MRSSFVRTALAAAFAVCAALSISTSAMSAGSSVSKAVSTPLKATQDAMKANDLQGALTHAKEAQAVDGRTDYDNYIINQFLGNIYIGLKDYKNAQVAFQAMADSPSLLPADKNNIYATTLQLAVNNQDWATAVRYGESLQAVGPLPPTIAEQLAVAYYNSGNHEKALVIAKTQIDADKAAGKQSSQALMQIMMSGLAKQNDNGAAVATLEGLAQDYGNADDWAKLIDLTFNTKGLNDIQALYLYRLRVVSNATTSLDDYAIMGNITTKAGYPGETVSLLEHGMAQGVVKAGDKAGAQLAAARVKVPGDKASLPAFEKQAVARKTGDYDIKLAETYYGYGRYAEAEAAASRAIGKGGMKDPSEGPMVLGMALTAEGKNADAVQAFAKVSGANDQKIAHLWTLYDQRKYGAAPAAH